MASHHFNVVSNTACTNKQGFYLGKVYYVGAKGGVFPPDEVDLGWKLPDSLDPKSVVRWVHGRMIERRNGDARLTIAEQQIVALGVQRLCYSRNHEGRPASPYLSGRLERVASLLIAKDKTKPFEVKPPQPGEVPENGIATMRYREAGLTPINNAVMLPVLHAYAEPHPTGSVIELHASTRMSKVYGGINDLVEVAQRSDIWPEAQAGGQSSES